MKAITKERLKDWEVKFGPKFLNKKVIEITGDYTPEIDVLQSADLILTTPEKWDGISRSWSNREYV